MKFVVSFIYLVMLLMSSMSWAAKTYITKDKVDVYDSPNGVVVNTWPKRTIFTSSSESDLWVTVSGNFPDRKWHQLDTKLFIKKSNMIKVRKPYQHKSARTIVYKTLKKVGPDAKAYKLLEDTEIFFNEPSSLKVESSSVENSDVERPYTESSSSSEDFVTPKEQESLGSKMDSADPVEPTLWTKDTVFTSTYENSDFIKVSGYFPQEKWQPLEKTVWIKKPVKVQDRTQPRKYERHKSSKRFAIIDKNKFELSVYEVVDGEKHKLMRTPVALGYDRCLSEAKGGKCYYTPEGEFEVEFKLFDPDGIQWCIPPKMSEEFKNKIAKGERCSRGTMGNYAMHFGNSYFLHGTSNPSSIGGRTTHGCVRLRNPDIEMVYQMLRNGDKVLISENPEEFDLVALSGYKPKQIIEETDKKATEKEMKLETKPIL